MTIEMIERKLKVLLGGTYGGPSISINADGEFVLYHWYDAPVGEDEIARGGTLEELIENCSEPLLIVCPQCKAKMGKMCVTPIGMEAKGYHKRRKKKS